MPKQILLPVLITGITLSLLSHQLNATEAASGPTANNSTSEPSSIAVLARSVKKASFTRSGEARIPKNWRSWIYVGTPLTPNALNAGSAPFPEFHNVYVEPSAFKYFEKTGKWAEGTQIVKELVLVRENNNNKDTGASSEVSGVGYFMGDFAGLELTVKDSKRFKDEPGGWAYFSFGHKKPPYNKTAKAFPTESCNACHEASAAYDFTFTQFYPVLRDIKASK